MKRLHRINPGLVAHGVFNSARKSSIRLCGTLILPIRTDLPVNSLGGFALDKFAENFFILSSFLLFPMNWLFENWLLLLPLALCGASVAWLMPTAASRPRGVGYLMGGLGLAILAGTVSSLGDGVGGGILFHLIAGVALISAVMMITNRNPVYAALWFALVTP